MSLLNNKESNFEINLLPVISLLAVCISFLLLTTVWVHIGTVDVKQAIGEPQQEKTQKEPPALWVSLFPNKKIVVSIKGDTLKKEVQRVFKSSNNEFNWSGVSQFVVVAKNKIPQLNTALVLPSQTTKYKDMIRMIDELKKVNMNDVGVAPL